VGELKTQREEEGEESREMLGVTSKLG